MAIPVRGGFVKLPPGVLVHDVVDACRKTAFDFLAGTSLGWGAVELDRWLTALTGTYAGLVASPPHALLNPKTNIEALLLAVANDVRDRLEGCASPSGRDAFARHMVTAGFVRGVSDAEGAVGYVPVDKADMVLGDRIASLLAADMLTRPRDYESARICEECGEMEFEWASCHLTSCDGSQESEIRVRHQATEPRIASFPQKVG